MNTKDKYIGKLLDGRYEILEVIGEGGMAVVYKALCHRLNRYDAVKIMRDDMVTDEEFRRRFCAESHAVAMLSHPNIVAIYDVSHSDEIEYIVMELVEGITLKQYMDRRGAVSWREAVHFSKQICKALSHAHERGIIHRDIKPQNIMLLRDGTIKVADFGIAALESEMHEDNGQAIGSVHYIAPEQARGAYPDARSDIYSLGVVMYEMLTGKKPYTGDTLAEVAIKHMNANPVAPHNIVEDIPPELERITLKAMCADLDKRYASANELLNDLENFGVSQTRVEEELVETPPVAPVRSVSELSKASYKRRRKRSSKVTYLAGTFGVLLCIIFLFSYLWSFWLGDIFAPAERLNLPKFVGIDYEAVVQNHDLAELYNFEVTFVVDPNIRPGLILSQFPDEGRSMMITPEGINVELTVSTSADIVPVPSVIGLDYREAISILNQAGFPTEVQNAVSSDYAKDTVMATSPDANDQVGLGTTVYLTVSSGNQISYVSMPNLIGLSEDSAIAQLQNTGLSYGGSERVDSSLEAGTVVWQNVAAFTEIEEHTKVILQVSTGVAD